MNATPLKSGLLLAAVLAAGAHAVAQQNPPGSQDYAAFSRFITDRNIFDPNRQPHYTSTYRPRPRRQSHVYQTPDLQLVGIMSYEKGPFAFFNGNNPDLKQALPVAGKIAGHTILEISANQVRLESDDKKEQLTLKVGDGLRLENGRWLPAESGSLPVNTAETTGAVSDDSSGTAPDAPASATEPNDVLKRLMQLREKENQ
jgi:hypothetical protein